MLPLEISFSYSCRDCFNLRHSDTRFEASFCCAIIWLTDIKYTCTMSFENEEAQRLTPYFSACGVDVP